MKKTRLLKIKQEKEKEEAESKQKSKETEEEQALQKKIDEINENIKTTKSSILNSLSIVIEENRKLTSINNNFDKTKQIKRVEDQSDDYLQIQIITIRNKKY